MCLTWLRQLGWAGPAAAARSSGGSGARGVTPRFPGGREGLARAGRRRTREALARKGSKSRTDARCRCRCFLFFRGERQEAARRGPRGRTARSAGRGGKRARAPRRPRPRPAPGPQPVLAGQEGGLFAARRLNSTNSPERRTRVPVLLQRLAGAGDEAPAWGGVSALRV